MTTEEKLRKVAAMHPDENVRAEAQRRLEARGAGAAGRIRSMESQIPGIITEEKNDPNDYPDNPSMRAIMQQKAQERSAQRMDRFANAATLGLAGRIAETVDPDYAERAQVRNEAFGDEPGSTAATAAGYLTPGGGASIIGRGAAAAVRPLARLGRLGRVAAVPVEGGLAGAGVGAAEAYNAGQDVSKGAVEGATTGAVFNAAARAAGAGLGATAKAVASPRTTLGRRIAAKEAGKEFLGSSSAKALPSGKDGVAQIADDEMQRLIAVNIDRRKAAGQAYDELAEKFLATVDDADTGAVAERIAGLQQANRNSFGIPLDDTLDNALTKVRSLLESKPGVPGTVDDLLKVRDLAKKKARFTQNGPQVTEEMEVWRDVYGMINDSIDALDQTGDFKAARAQYREAMEKARTINELITGRGKESLQDAAGTSMSGANRLKTMATSGGVGTAGRVGRELSSLDPEAAEAMRRIAAVDARNALEIGVPRSRTITGIAGQYAGNIGEGAVALGRFADDVMGGGMQAGQAAGLAQMAGEDAGPPTPPEFQLPEAAAPMQPAPPVDMRAELVRKAQEARAQRRQRDRANADRLLQGRRKRMKRERAADAIREVDPISGMEMTDEPLRMRTVDPY